MNTSYPLQNQSSLSPSFFSNCNFLLGLHSFGMMMNSLTCFSHIYPESLKYFLALHEMLSYFPFCHISPHFSFPKLFGSPLFQRHVPPDVPLTQAMLPLNQYHV